MNVQSWIPKLAPTLTGLQELAGDRRRLLAFMVIVSVLAFLFEGLAIYLIFPLIELLAGNGLSATHSGPLAWVGRAVSNLPDDLRVTAVVTAIVVCILIKSLITFLATAVFSKATQQIGDDIRRKCFAQVLSASPLHLGARPSGALVNTLSNQTWAVSQGLEQLAKLILNACAVGVFFVLLLTVSWKATLTIIGGVAFAVVAAILVNLVIRKVSRKAVKANEDLSVKMLEGLSGHTTLRLFNGEEAAQTRFDAASDQTRRMMYILSLASAVPQLLLEVLFAAVTGIVLVLLSDGNIGEVLVLIALLLRMQPHAIGLVYSRAILAGITGAIENLQRLRDDALATREPSGLPKAPRLTQSLNLSDVHFTYPLAEGEAVSKTALHGITCDFAAGQVTALVGHSGSGKSTIAMMLCGLTTPESGEVIVDGQNLADFDAASWRDNTAFVPQNVFLFNQSVRDNILIGREGASVADIEAAARAAHAHDFIKGLPQGYETRVGDRGESLSGGQRQRIALARALLRAPDLLILDEATNALDPRSEQLVSDALNLKNGSRTTVVIAHRLSTIQRADKVIVLDEGRVVEVGTPGELATKHGPFAALFGSELKSA